MKTGIYILLSLLVLLFCTAPVTAKKNKKLCFRKRIKCCYKFERCGEVEKKAKKVYKCPKKICRKVCECRPDCHEVVSGREHVCYPKYYKARVCDKKSYYYSEKNNRHRPHCHYVRKTRKVCEYRPKYRQVCKKKCHCYPRCYYKPYYCVRYNIYKFPKFCPKIVCSKPKVKKMPKKPDHYLGEKYFVRKTEEERYDHYPKW